MSNPTAGSGEPFWYEWTVGLLNIVKMLHADSEIQSVTLQAYGIKGWDDVVVAWKGDRRDYYQIKHSRNENNLTFGTLVSTDDGGDSLLRALFLAFCEMKLTSTSNSCTIFTNREAGSSIGHSKVGVLRPPLLKFMTWLKEQAKKCKTIGEFRPPNEWTDAWTEWTAQLADKSETERLDFLRAFEVRTDQKDLDELTGEVLNELAEIFGSSPLQVHPLLQALDHALRDWSRSGVAVTPEKAMDALALSREIRGEHRAPPPPAPFFPSREPFIRGLEADLTSTGGPPVIFVSADPGAGKTSVLSELANRRSDDALKGVVGIRYFAFRPITPDSPIIPADSDHFVKVESLWFDLLRQLRRGLMGRLRAYSVPVRDELLNWSQARTHVLRIAAILSKELNRPFVIAIDGIDHAARAAIYNEAGAREFFSSLPAPEELSATGIRLLLAGQPAENYLQYPQWLRAPSDVVKRLSLSRLKDEDIELLLVESAPPFPADQRNAAVRTILEITDGNTLSVVFAAAEAATCENVEKLRSRLEGRSLQSGITTYYRSIWEHCLAGEAPDISPKLAGVICLAQERLTGEILSSVFPDVGWPASKWTSLLRRLGPLLVEEPEGFRVRHNDIRVFLQGCLTVVPEMERQAVAGAISNHYIKPCSNRLVAHKTLFSLLELADRKKDRADLFSTTWVLEAIALGFDVEHLENECTLALQSVWPLRDWELLSRVSCAGETLERWRETQEYSSSTRVFKPNRSIPVFLGTEAFVRPLNEWDSGDLMRLAEDAEELFEGGEKDRATALVKRWVGGLDIPKLCECLTDLEEGPVLHSAERNLGPSAADSLEVLGRICRRANVNLSRETCVTGIQADAAIVFEKGWVAACCKYGPFDSLPTCFGDESLHFFGTITQAASSLAKGQHWLLLNELLAYYAGNAKAVAEWQTRSAYMLAWYSLLGAGGDASPEWLAAVKERNLKADCAGDEGIYTALYAAKMHGWQDVGKETGTIATRLIEALALNEYRERDRPVFATWLRAAAVIGRTAGVLSRRGAEVAGEMLRPQELQQVLTALWDTKEPLRALLDTSIAGKLADELVEIVEKLGTIHRATAFEAARPAIEQWPVDNRRKGLWIVARMNGQFELLRSWIEQWLGDNGFIWQESPDSRDPMIESWRPFAEELGDTTLVEKALERQAWSRIAYRTDKDDTFHASSALLEELLRIQPQQWVTLGIKLWSLADAASFLGGSIMQSTAIEGTIAKAVLRLTPSALCRLIFADIPHRDNYWHSRMRDALVEGMIEVAREGHWPNQTKLSLWCLANGFCRWFSSHDIGLLWQLQSAFLDTTAEEQERASLLRQFAVLTPGEALRRPKESDQEKRENVEVVSEESIEESLDKIAKGHISSARECVRLIDLVLRTQPANAQQTIRAIIFRMVDRNEWATSWRWEGLSDHLLKLAPSLSEEHLWILVEAACSEAGERNHWLQAVIGNLHLLLFAWASRKGTKVLVKFLAEHLEMHELWIKGGRKELSYSEISVPSGNFPDTWEEASSQILTFLLNSRSGEVVASATRATHALVHHVPAAISWLFAGAGDDPWKARWILNGAEAWAFLFPEAVEAVQNQLEIWLHNDSLEHRLQAWLVLTALARRRGSEAPHLPWPEQSLPIESQDGRRRDILDLPPETHGLMLTSTRHRSAEQHMVVLEAVFGMLPDVRHIVAQLLDGLPERGERDSWPASIRQHGDTYVGLPDIGLFVGQALQSTLRGIPQALVPKLAQAFLPNEDPWTMRTSPLPDPGMDKWPKEEEIGEYRKPPNIPAIRQKLLLLACEHNIEVGERVLAATVEIFTTFHDVRYHTWWVRRNSPIEPTLNNGLPTTISARSFSWWLGDWWEDSYRNADYPIAFVTGGSQRLVHSFVPWFPSKLWLQQLGWEPDPQNVNIWLKNGIQVVRFERFHGELKDTRGHHERQPTLSRWVASPAAWEELESLGEWQRTDRIERRDSPEK